MDVDVTVTAKSHLSAKLVLTHMTIAVASSPFQWPINNLLGIVVTRWADI
jgi:hypothetical protein